MNKFSEISRQVLNTLKSATIAAMTDYDISLMLNDMIFRAIASFRFPKISLTYKPLMKNGHVIDYQFDNIITQREVNVILALVKVAWLEQQLDNEVNFENIYYDKDVRIHSRGNLIKAIEDRYRLAKEEAKTAQYNYYRVTQEGLPAVTDIYG
jgi:hypothetical protein